MGFFADLNSDRGADFAPGRIYRYLLWRVWDRDKPRAMVVGLNPSTADESRDDPTMRKIRGHLERHGYGGFTMTNLYDYITPYPEELPQDRTFRHGPAHWKKMENAAQTCKCVIAAWGASPCARPEIPYMMDFLRYIGLPVLCLGLSKGGLPRHPLFVPYGTPLTAYRGD